MPLHRQWIYTRPPIAAVGREHYQLREQPLDSALTDQLPAALNSLFTGEHRGKLPVEA